MSWGPFTYSKDTYGKPLGVVVDSGEVEYPGCCLRIRGFGHTLIVELPQIVKPQRRKVKGRNWSYDAHPREYGFQYDNGFFRLFYGAQTHDSDTTQVWCKHLPWTQWRHARISLYTPDGAHFWTQTESRGMDSIKEQIDAEAACPSVTFAFDDYDGKRITATCRIQEREWRFGQGRFKWLSLFRRPHISRTLNLSFSEEVGPEKGSWKGGTVGHSTEMLPGESCEEAFRRYCEKEHRSKNGNFRVTFVGAN